MDLAGVDLNLLVVFDALMAERHVTRAGERIGLSQPAMSAALSWLRHLLKDELFIRRSDGMHPTRRAQELAVPLRQALLQIQAALEPETFVPTEAKRTFKLDQLGRNNPPAKNGSCLCRYTYGTTGGKLLPSRSSN
jgi:DNA-binding transcriptional LysR family regulator